MRSAQLRLSAALPRGAKVQRLSSKALATEGGFSILEVMTSAFIMVLVFVSALVVLQRSFQAIDTARYTTLAGQILQSQMEKLRLLSWSQLTDSTNGPVNTNSSGSNYISDTKSYFTPDVKTTSGQVSNFKCTQEITSGGADIRNITLTATWAGADGRQHSLSYFSIYVHHGISDFIYTYHH